jgi:hypothetical protein
MGIIIDGKLVLEVTYGVFAECGVSRTWLASSS